jgi:hypothetical protein
MTDQSESTWRESVIYQAQQDYLRLDYISLIHACGTLVARATQEGYTPGSAGKEIVTVAEMALSVIGENELAQALRSVRDAYGRSTAKALASEIVQEAAVA